MDIDVLISEMACGVHAVSEDELQRVLEHLAGASFDPDARERVRGELDGMR